jgi:hypothetical protein
MANMLNLKPTQPTLSPARPLLHDFGRHLVLVTVFNAGCALAITYLFHLGGNFLVNLVFSLCIGTLALTLIDGSRLLLWGRNEPPKQLFLPLILAAAPLAYVLGSLLAAGVTRGGGGTRKGQNPGDAGARARL